MSWSIHSKQLDITGLLNEESLFFTGNGYVGVRGNFEEGAPKGAGTIRGTYLNAFHDITDIAYGEKLFGFPETQQKLVNIIDAQTVRLYFGEGKEKEAFSLFDGEVLEYDRYLHMDRGVSERVIRWRSPMGKEVRVSFKRMASFIHPELFLQEITIEPISFFGKAELVAVTEGDVSNFTDPNDPRVGSGHAKLLAVSGSSIDNGVAGVEVIASRSRLKAACAVVCELSVQHSRKDVEHTKAIESTFVFELDGKAVFLKKNVYTDTLRHGNSPLRKGFELAEQLRSCSFAEAEQKQKEYLNDFWRFADVEIKGDEKLQEGIRFNLYHLLQSAGRDRYSNIAAKGLSGEGYEGHYFWDTEIYMIPVFLMTNPELAKKLLLYRYSILDAARARAKEMGHRQGALFPWRTISGPECSSYYPAGTAQYHISADIAYSYIQYYLVTKDIGFLKECGAEVLIETARLWIDTGHYHNGQFKIDAVTGPDEYTCIVNNNYYTNVMARYNLRWAAKAVAILAAEAPQVMKELEERLGLEPEETEKWIKASEAMYLPYDEELNINPQDDTFLQKAVWDFEQTPNDHYPLLLHYHPLTLYRYQVCKQADTVLAHFLLEDEQDASVIKSSYDYYEKVTTHDSSLSSCVFSIMAAKTGNMEKAYDYFIETSRLDLDNTHGNTKDGLHMANMGGTWMAIVHGFAGLRVKESGLSFAPAIPQQWEGYQFSIQYEGRHVEVMIDSSSARFSLISGPELVFHIYGNPYTLGEPGLEVPLIR